MAKVKFINFEDFYSLVKAFRIVWFRGRFGGGKTSLAAMISAKLLADEVVDRVVSNIPLAFKDKEVPIPLENSCILLDESWIYLDSRSKVTDYAAFVRKFNHYLLLPSVWAPHSRLTMLYCERFFNAYTVGLPFWIYRWVLNNKVSMEKGYFAIGNPAGVFNYYDSSYVPGTDGGISEAIKLTAMIHGYKGSSDEQNKDDNSEILDAIEDTNFELQEGIVAIKTLSSGFRKHRRK